MAVRFTTQRGHYSILVISEKLIIALELQEEVIEEKRGY